MRSLKIAICSMMAFGVGCSSAPSPNEPVKSEQLNQEYHLKEDRSALDALRKDVPDDVKGQNDELAFSLNITNGGKKSPAEVWSKFNESVSKKRDTYNKVERKAREGYNKNEKRSRDDFLAQQKKTREEFYSKKPSSEDRSRFSNDQDNKRHEFFDNEHDQRQEWESGLREKRNDFDAYMREKRSDFDNEMKEYSKDYYDQKRVDSAKERAKEKARLEPKPPSFGGAEQPAQPAIPDDPDLKEFQSVPKGHATKLEPPGADGQ